MNGCIRNRHKESFGTLTPGHAYLSLPGTHLVHPFPLFNCRYLSADLLDRLESIHLTYDEAAKLRYLCNGIPRDKVEEIINNQLAKNSSASASLANVSTLALNENPLVRPPSEDEGTPSPSTEGRHTQRY
mmetsp:Transcript_24689/g.72246  ORF Transcript_24689/g.72246 Transcript_24689/m.72246 type:complete len:130 (+) Transcript_24689:3020-3409(+)